MRTALGEAVRRRQVAQNAAALARPPRVEQQEIEPYTIEEVRLILKAAAERRNAARGPSPRPSASDRARCLISTGLISTWMPASSGSGPTGSGPSTSTAARCRAEEAGLVSGTSSGHRGRRAAQVQGRPPPNWLAAGTRRTAGLTSRGAGSGKGDRRIALAETYRMSTNELGEAIKPNSDYHA